MPRSVEDRFWGRVSKGGADECWEWQGYRHGETCGYGRLVVDGARVYAHRFAYELANGSIPEGMTLDHLCRNHSCVNPAHLEAVSRGENVLRGQGPTATRARQTHCGKGHEFTDENTYRNPRTGHRRCRTCHRVSLKASYRARKARANA